MGLFATVMLDCHDTCQAYCKVLSVSAKCLAIKAQVINLFTFSLAARVLVGGEFFYFSYNNNLGLTKRHEHALC